MKSLLALPLTLFALSATAHTLHIENNQMYVGQEEINEHKTGNTCYIRVSEIIETPQRGNFCKNIKVQFLHNSDAINKEPVLLYSRVTNNHRPEYPKVKACVENINGTSFGDEIYGDKSEALYNPLFSNATKIGGTTYDYYLSIRASTKAPFRARIHSLSWSTENNVDCINLKPL